MSMFAMTLRRLRMPACRTTGYSRRSCSTPSMRQRICSTSSRGSTCRSDAFMPTASDRAESTTSMIEASWALATSSAGVPPLPFSSESRSLPRLLEKIEMASSKADSPMMAVATLRFVRSRTSSIAITSRGLVMPSTSSPLSSRPSGSTRWRTMKSRGSMPMAAAEGCAAAQVDGSDAHLAGERVDQLLLADPAGLDQDLAEAAARVALQREGLFELPGADDAALRPAGRRA